MRRGGVSNSKSNLTYPPAAAHLCKVEQQRLDGGEHLHHVLDDPAPRVAQRHVVHRGHLILDLGLEVVEDGRARVDVAEVKVGRIPLETRVAEVLEFLDDGALDLRVVFWTTMSVGELCGGLEQATANDAPSR